LNRLAAALLLEPDFPALPDGFGRLLDRDRGRTAARQLADSRERQYRSYTKKGAEPTPRDPKSGRPYIEIDIRLAAQTSATLQDLEATRLDLFREYFEFVNRDETSNHAEVQSAALALLARYWQSQGRLLRLEIQRPSKLSPPSSRGGITAQLHPPVWKDQITREVRRTLDHLYLFWSDPLPGPAVAESLTDSQKARQRFARSLTFRRNYER
jgi:hypothetical protein